MEMIELKNSQMSELLLKGLSIAYSIPSLENGSMKDLVPEKIIDGKTYVVQLMFDSRINKGIPYVIVMMKESECWMDNWTHFLARSIEY